MVADSKDSDFQSSTTDGLDKVNVNYDFTDDSLETSRHFNLLSGEDYHGNESKALPSKYDETLSKPSECNVLKVNFLDNNTDKKQVNEHDSNDFVIQIEDDSKNTSSTTSETHQETDLRHKRKSPSKKRRAMGPNKKTCFKVPSENVEETVIEYEFAPNLSFSSEEELMECTSSSDSRFADVEDNAENYSSTSEELACPVERTAESSKDSSDESKKLMETSYISDSRIADVNDNRENSSDPSEELKILIKRTEESSNTSSDESKRPMQSCSCSDFRIANIKDNVENSRGTSEKRKSSIKRTAESSNASSDESKRPMKFSSGSDYLFADIEDSTESSNSLSSEEINREFYEISKSSSKSLKTLDELNRDFKKNRNEVNKSNSAVEVPTHKLELTSVTGSKSNTLSESILPNSLKMRSDVVRNKKRRCFVCKKKLDLTAVTCRCGGLFCSKHRYDREHSCTFDYKTMGAEQLRKDNPQVVAEKISRL